MSGTPTITLNDGNRIPQVGLGVWQIDNRGVADVVAEAFRVGYRLIDTAQAYENEEGVGQALANCGLPRDEVFITSKLRNSEHRYDAALLAFEGSTARLGLDYLDMFLIHWPIPEAALYPEAWRALVRLQQEGRVKSIGVSNFESEHLRRIVGDTGVTPAVNQIKLHPFGQQRAARRVHAEMGIAIEAYSPLARGAVLGDPVIAGIARKHTVTVGQVVLRWAVEQNLIVIPKSTRPERLRTNFDLFGFALDDADRAAIDALDRPVRR